MIPHLSHIMTLANGVIGVSVLAMPFCFKQCGIVLAAIVLLTSSVLSRLACHFLIKSAVMSRRRNYEFLAFHAFGTTGKFLAELFIIGFLLGTCIAFFVVVGDLGPQIIGKMLNKRPEDIRTSVLVTTGTFIVLPLGLLRNIDSLSSVCTATIGFYLCLVVKVICESTRHIFLGDWYDSVIYWRPAGILQCLPIFSMALFCQTQLFEIYEAIPNVCLEKMNQVVRGALNICTLVYLCVGFFGYVAFCTQPFTGNILMSFEPSLTSDVIKMGFVFSVAFSFPLVIFPCRASLNSLLFRRAHTHEPTNNYIPEVRFRCLTLTIVSMALGTGILIPNIEFLLGIVGSTIGVMICVIFPAAFFIAISTKNTNERLIAQAILFFGMWIMVLGTYANIYAMEESSNARLLITTGKPLLDQINDMPFKNILKEDFPIDKIILHQVHEKPESPKDNEISETLDVRREPPIPVERTILTERPIIEMRNLPAATLRPSLEKTIKDTKNVEKIAKEIDPMDDPGKKLNDPVNDVPVEPVSSRSTSEDKKSPVYLEQQKNENLIDSDAIKKEETELEAAAAGEEVDLEAAARREKLRQTLEKHEIEKLEMMEERKEILKNLKEQNEKLESGKKRLGSDQIKNERHLKIEKIPEKPDGAPLENGVLRNGKILTSTDKLLSTNDRVSGSEKISGTLIVSGKIINSQESRGPILNALTNWTSKRQNLDSVEPRTINETEDPSRIETVKKSVEISPPIAIRMSDNAIKLPNVGEKIGTAVNNSVDDNLAIRRDILEHREKRETLREDKNLTRLPESWKIIEETRSVDEVELETDERRNFVNVDEEQCKLGPRKNKDNFDVFTSEKTKTRVATTRITVGIDDLGNKEIESKIVSSGDIERENLSMLKKRELRELKRDKQR